MGRETIPGHWASDWESYGTKTQFECEARQTAHLRQNGDDTDQGILKGYSRNPCTDLEDRRCASGGTPCMIFAHELGVNVDFVEHGWHGCEVWGLRRSEQRRWWLAGEEPGKSQVIQQVRRCNSRSSTTREPMRVFVDRPCLGNVEVVESCGEDSTSRPIQSSWYMSPHIQLAVQRDTKVSHWFDRFNLHATNTDTCLKSLESQWHWARAEPNKLCLQLKLSSVEDGGLITIS